MACCAGLEVDSQTFFNARPSGDHLADPNEAV